MLTLPMWAPVTWWDGSIRALSDVVPVRQATLGISNKAVSLKEPVAMANPTPATPAQSASSIERGPSSAR